MYNKGVTMWQKFFYSCFLVLISGIFNLVLAETVEVEAVTPFSTENPPASIAVKLNDPLRLSETILLKAGDVIHGDLIDVVSPKRLKRDASFSFKPNFYMEPDGKTHDINIEVVATYTKTIDKGDLAKSAALGVGNFFVKGLSMGAAAVEGAVKNQEDNRLKSSAKSVYEASPFSYVEKGEELEIKPAQIFYLKFPDAEDISKNNGSTEHKGENYTYNIEKE